jgi:hypothetical protein
MRMGKTIFLEIHDLSKPITEALTYIETAENAMSNWKSKGEEREEVRNEE